MQRVGDYTELVLNLHVQQVGLQAGTPGLSSYEVHVELVEA